MLIDSWMPAFGASERHEIRVGASARHTFDAITTADLAAGVLVRALLALRALPKALASGTNGMLRLRRDLNGPFRLDAFERAGFRLLDEQPPHELVLGLEGRFWSLGGGISSLGADGFRAPIPDGVARAIWNFAVQPLGEGGCRLSTETRVGWSDAAAGRSFRRYWRLIRPWSGLTRRHMLRSIRAEAERKSGR